MLCIYNLNIQLLIVIIGVPKSDPEKLLLAYNHSITCYNKLMCDKAIDFGVVIDEPVKNFPFYECCKNDSNSILIDEQQYCVAVCYPTRCFKYAYECEIGSEEIPQQEYDNYDKCCMSGSSMLLLNGDDKFSICLQCPEQLKRPSGVGLDPSRAGVGLDSSRSGVGLDPHFSVLLPTGHQLCFTVQGEQGFVFNLIHSPHLTVNAFFIPDEFKDKITWIGSLAVIINKIMLRFEASSKTVHINEENILSVRNDGLHITLLNGEIHKTVISSFSSSYVLVDIKDMGLHFSVEYVNHHLDIIYYKIPTSGFNCSYRGLLGQFFCPGYSIDEVRKLLLFPSADREPIPVMERPIWSFMERENRNGLKQQMCWMAMNTGYQGEGLLNAHYLKYVLPDLFSSVKHIYRKDQQNNL